MKAMFFPRLLEIGCTLVLSLGGVALVFAQQAPPPPVEATPTRVELPTDFAKTFKRYDMVDKDDRKRVRFLYVNPSALTAAKAGEPFPDGTILVMEDHEVALDARGAVQKDAKGRLLPTGRVSSIAVMEKRAGWGESNPFSDDKDNGDWEYASFKADGSPNPVKLDGCYACHLPQKSLDFTFSGAKIYEAAKP